MKHIFILLTFLLFNLITFCQTYEDVSKFYGAGEKDKALELGLKYLKKDSLSTELNHIIGRVYAERKQYDKAIPYLEKGARKENTQNWIQAWSLAYLGEAYYLTDKYENSKEALEACLKLNATPTVNKFAKRRKSIYLMELYFDNWIILETEHIRFHFQDTSVIKNIESYMQRRESALLKNNEFFNANLFKKIELYAWSTRENMKEILGTESGFANSKKYMIHKHYNQTPGHEITHILSDIGIRPIEKTKLINEGTAVYFDGTVRNRLDIAKSDLKGSEISIKQLWNNPKDYPLSYYYTVSGAFVEHLFGSGNEEQFKQLVKNQTYKNAKKVYKNLDEIIEEFESKLKN
jgi:tetratricopeptide (TPR) repeat protein